MKVLFIYPNANSQLGFAYGIAHISSVLKQAGHTVDLWQLCEDISPLPSKSEFIARLSDMAPDVIGFSVVTNQWAYAQELAKWAREATSAPLVCGGIHALAAPEEILRTGLFDYVFRGEAEEAFLEFVEKWSRQEDVTEVRNLGHIQNGNIRINPVRPLPELKELPPKDYDIFDFQKIIDAKNGWVGLMASRGCPFSCTYCFNHQMVKYYRKDLHCSFKELNYIRHFDIEQMIAEIDYLLSHYRNINMFIFDDDLFTFYRPYVAAFCQAYKKVCSIPFVVNAHVGFFDAERARSLAEANCKIVKFGVESGSARIRRQILNRHMTNEKISKSIQTAHAFGLHTSVFLMIGLPGETLDDLMATIRLMAAAKPGRYRWSFFYPFPGTKAHELSAKFSHIDYKKMEQLENFTERSCLDFGEAHNLFLKKVGSLMPWFVNAYSDLPVADFYRKKLDEMLSLDSREWEQRAPGVVDEDKSMSGHFVKQGMSHYAIKYNPFMGVISDYFTAEDKKL
ncbi:MAG: radical SAM protein [Thermodesulfobacteriota bacterium]|nr:radical SAM protein [Thermodesulfobacteriota bacterium]